MAQKLVLGWVAPPDRLCKKITAWSSNYPRKHCLGLTFNRAHYIRERERRRVWVLSERGLVLCFRLRDHVICYFRLKTTSFAFLPRFFFTCFHVINSCYDHNNTVHGWHSWRTRRLTYFWWVGSTKLIFVNLFLLRTTFSQDFVVDEWPTTSFPPVLHHTDNYAWGQWPNKQIRTRRSPLSFSDFKLPTTS